MPVVAVFLLIPLYAIFLVVAALIMQKITGRPVNAARIAVCGMLSLISSALIGGAAIWLVERREALAAGHPALVLISAGFVIVLLLVVLPFVVMSIHE
jgi:hypothetical protein